MLDTKTLSTALILILIIGSGLHLVNWRMHRDNPGAKWWALGLCVQTCGAIATAVANAGGAPIMPLLMLFNVLALSGMVMLVYGTACFSGHALPRAVYTALGVLIVVGIGWATLIEPSATTRLGVFGLVQLISNSLILSRLGYIARRDGAMGVVVLAASVVSLFVLMGSLITWQLVSQPEIAGLYANSDVLVLALLTLIACKTTMIFGYLLLSSGYSQARLEQLALSDPLTGLPNRRAFERTVTQRLASVRKTDRLIALAIFDVDHFKQINDTHGHDAGDAVLRHLGRVATAAVRPHDFLARVGGEEFAVIFDVEDAAELVTAANRLRLAIEINHARINETAIAVTVSVGAVLARSENGLDFSNLYRAADQALYSAKGTGRNRVVVGEVEPVSMAA
ncbi:GGDEF domain-containing protein [Maricaulis salignorans]|uniref:diguanylate cyclase n=1 Tax=Maricaulis salignorans TaxID=144026 RepID=A0A1G9NZ71_9PROT|nr:GGDEF domain-containing protein [Maricaulis salignorans]SDL91603.1 diguanylate cyclase (GGDEF) domain-containing protein [Maricaulis salignorans]